MMQLRNSSASSYGQVVQITNNQTWIYPNPPGGVNNIIRQQFAGCVPSNTTLSAICCSAVNGSFVTQTLTDRKSLNQIELENIYKSRNRSTDQQLPDHYHSDNPSEYETGNYTYVNDNEPGFVENMNWCKMEYNPLSSKRLVGLPWTTSLLLYELHE
ncbi:uncharacterized protein L201_003162 [Kwoniella dendrophila CBS 6074]|uniref:Uncharacterized protein n=1 Tax=Kwoniella dendrophila CBS 6074 TaxID=1295534 RepID=A0AAX4JS93_9TREE